MAIHHICLLWAQKCIFVTSVYSEATSSIKGLSFCLLLGDLNLTTTVHSNVP